MHVFDGILCIWSSCRSIKWRRRNFRFFTRKADSIQTVHRNLRHPCWLPLQFRHHGHPEPRVQSRKNRQVQSREKTAAGRKVWAHPGSGSRLWNSISIQQVQKGPRGFGEKGRKKRAISRVQQRLWLVLLQDWALGAQDLRGWIQGLWPTPERRCFWHRGAAQCRKPKTRSRAQCHRAGPRPAPCRGGLLFLLVLRARLCPRWSAKVPKASAQPAQSITWAASLPKPLHQWPATPCGGSSQVSVDPPSPTSPLPLLCLRSGVLSTLQSSGLTTEILMIFFSLSQCHRRFYQSRMLPSLKVISLVLGMFFFKRRNWAGVMATHFQDLSSVSHLPLTSVFSFVFLWSDLRLWSHCFCCCHLKSQSGRAPLTNFHWVSVYFMWSMTNIHRIWL